MNGDYRNNPVFLVWKVHMAECQACRLAIHERVGGGTLEDMLGRCCDVEHELYVNFLAENSRNSGVV
jgi:hypothetical protein